MQLHLRVPCLSLGLDWRHSIQSDMSFERQCDTDSTCWKFTLNRCFSLSFHSEWCQ